MTYGPYSYTVLSDLDGTDEVDIVVNGETRKTKLSTLKSFIHDYSDDSYWDDLRIPVTSLNPAGNASPPDVDQDLGGTLLFASNATEVIGFVIQLPHSYYAGTDLEPHVHWAKTTSASGNVQWQFDYKWAKIGEEIDSSWTTLTSSTPVAGTPDTDTANKHLITGFSSIDGTGASFSDMLICTLARDHDHESDTYGADARLLEIDIHFQIAGIGTDGEYSN